MNQLIEFLSRPENHGTRNLLKWLQAFLGVSTGAGAATGSWQSLVTGLLFVFVKWLEAEASKVANESRIAQPEDRNDILDHDPEPLTPTEKLTDGDPEPRYTGYVPCKKCGETHWLYGMCPEKMPIPGALPVEIVIPRVTPPSTFPTAEDIEKTEVILAGDKLHEVEFWNDDGERKVKSFADKYEAIKFRNAKKYAKLL